MKIQTLVELDPQLNLLLDDGFDTRAFIQLLLEQSGDKTLLTLQKLHNLKTMVRNSLKQAEVQSFEERIGRLLADEQFERAKGEILLYQIKLKNYKKELDQFCGRSREIKELEVELKTVLQQKSMLEQETVLKRLLFKLKATEESSLAQRSQVIRQLNLQLEGIEPGKMGAQRAVVKSAQQSLAERLGSEMESCIRSGDINLMLGCSNSLLNLGLLAQSLKRTLNNCIRKATQALKDILTEEYEATRYRAKLKSFFGEVKSRLQFFGRLYFRYSQQQLAHLESKGLSNFIKLFYDKYIQLFYKIFAKLKQQPNRTAFDNLAANYPLLLSHQKKVVRLMQEVVGEQQGQTCFTKDEIADLLASSAVLSEAFYSALRDRCRLLISNMERDKTRNTEELRRLVQEQSEHDSEVTRFIVREVLSLSGGVAQRQEWAKSLLSWVSTTQSRSLDIAELVRFVERL